MIPVTDSPEACYFVTAKQQAYGWELRVPDLGVTQVSTLDKADRQVRDFIATMHGTDDYTGDVYVTPDIEGVADEVHDLRQNIADIAHLNVELAQRRWRIIHAMRERGLSYADIGGAIGVTKARVAQLIKAGNLA